MMTLTRIAHKFEEAATTTGQAHVTVHVEPNDEPRAGEPASVLVEVSGVECGCELQVTQEGEPVLTSELDSASSSTALVFPSSGPAEISVTAAGESFGFTYYVQEVRADSNALMQVGAIGATLLVTAVVVGVIRWFGRKKNRSAGGHRSLLQYPLGPRLLIIVGLILIGIGAFYVLAAHDILERIPLFAELPHSAHVYIGGGGAALGLVCLLLGELLRRRRLA